MYEIFKAGTYHDGQAVFTESDVEAIAENYDPHLQKAPLTLDHIQEGRAYGWIPALKAENGILLAEFEQVGGDLIRLVNSGEYGPVSAEIYPADSPKNPKPGKPYLKALTFLGAQAPAVKGLSPVVFAEGGAVLYFFGENMTLPEDSLRHSPAPARRAGSAQDDIQREEENKLDDIEKLKAQIADQNAQIAERDKRLAERDAELNKFSESQKAAEAEVVKLREENTRGEHAAKVAGYKAFAEGLVNAGQLPPATKDKIVFLMDAMDQMNVTTFAFKVDGTIMKSGDYFAFAEGGENGKTLTPVETLKSVLSCLPKILTFGEHTATGADADGGGGIADQAAALAQEKNISYRQAVKQLAGGKS